MILDFSFQDIMNLSNIKRWGIIDMSREQSVAEHSYNVTMISLHIVKEMDFNDEGGILEYMTMNWALVHDLPEISSGDIPTPMKSYLKDSIAEMEKEKFPNWHSFKETVGDSLSKKIVKIADYIDAIQFAESYCVDKRKEQIIGEMIIKMATVVEEVKSTYEIDISKTVQSFLE